MSFLEKRTAAELKRVCQNIGIPHTGRKGELIDLICNSLSQRSIFKRVPNDKRNFNILSIDMGIRNFSYAKLQLDKTLPFNRAPLIKEWAKFDVNDWADVSGDISYEPLKYSMISNRVVDDIVFNNGTEAPDVILIERQRIRSSSSKNVLEWVFRVNMFESMLHALIYSRMQSDERLKETMVVSTSPKKMGAYWSPLGAEKLKTKDSKKLRLQLVQSWLKRYIDHRSTVPFSLPADNLLPLIEQSNARSKSRWIFDTITRLFKSDKDTLGVLSKNLTPKGDDFVDSLLHGLAFIEWEKQKMILDMEFKLSPDDLISTSEKMYESHLRSLDYHLDRVAEDMTPSGTEKKAKGSKKTSEQFADSDIVEKANG